MAGSPIKGGKHRDHAASQRAYQARHQPEKLQRERPKPQFVALDGEGTNQPDGSQWYTLLCAYGPFGRRNEPREAFIEQYERGGLTTEDCLEFLLRIGWWRSLVYVGFFFNYDVTKMLSDLTESERRALWDGGWVTHYGKGSHKHYYLRWLPTKMLTVAEISAEVAAKLASDPAYKLNHHQDFRRSVLIYDVSGFFQTSFVRALEAWGVATPDLELIATMKGRRNDFASGDRLAIRTYCLAECRALVTLMERLADALWDAGLYLNSWHGAGAIASHMLRLNGVKQHIEPVPPAVEQAVLGAYFGGRMEIFQQGWFPGGVYNYDLQSAYPSAAITLPSLKDATWRRVREYDPRDPHALWLVSWDVTRLPTVPLVGPFPYRRSSRVYFPFKGGATWIHAVELSAGMSLYGADCFTVHDGWSLTPSPEYAPFEWVRTSATARIQAKANGEPKHIPLKLGLNSLYGKLAQGALEAQSVPPFLCYYWAGRITATTRATMLREAMRAGGSLVAVATDGLFTTEPVDGLPLGNTPGTWEDNGRSSGVVVIQAGVMYSENARLVKTRGYGKTTLNFEQMREEWDKNGPFGVVHYQERRFIGLGACCATHKFGDYGRWLAVERRLRFMPGSKWHNNEYWQMGDGIAYDNLAGADVPPASYRLYPSDCSRKPSAVYQPKALLDPSLAADLLEMQINYLEREDQPEWEDWEVELV